MRNPLFVRGVREGTIVNNDDRVRIWTDGDLYESLCDATTHGRTNEKSMR